MPEGDANERAKAREIQKQLDEAHEKEEEIFKLLLLGAGESGKSTLFKQMLMIYGPGLQEKDRQSYRNIIHGNMVMCMKELVIQAGKREQKDFALDSSNAEKVDLLDDLRIDSKFTLETGEVISELWKDPAIKKTYALRDQFQMPDTMSHFFDRTGEISKQNYIPSEEDVLRARSRTTGVVESHFNIDGNQFHMFDVGGQRSERKKWIHCFEGVSCVLFVSAISSYNQLLYEDGKTNRLEESLNLFEEVCNYEWFKDSAIILFLNKRDLFQEKIKKFPITTCPILEGYEGEGTDWQTSAKYIEEEFLIRNKTQRTVLPHLTCATDRSNVEVVFNTVKDTVLKQSLDKAGLLTSAA